MKSIHKKWHATARGKGGDFVNITIRKSLTSVLVSIELSTLEKLYFTFNHSNKIYIVLNATI